MRLTSLLLFVLLMGMLACSPEDALPLSPFASGFARDMDSLRVEYQEARLSDAMVRAGQLRQRILGAEDSIPAPRLAELYQYLAQLHFHHLVYVDSVDYYTRAAESLIPDAPPDTLLARQLLCAAYNGFEEFAWVDMQVRAQLGRKLLQRAGLEESQLYAELMMIEARAIKQYADRSMEMELRPTGWSAADGRMRVAIELLDRLHSNWKPYALEHRLILLVRFAKPGEIRAVVDSLQVDFDADLAAGTRPFGYPERALGYFHAARVAAGDSSARDSVDYYYARLLARPGIFMTQQLQEALFQRRRISLARGKFVEALAYARSGMFLESCCPAGTDTTRTDFALGCNRRVSCIHYVRSLGEVYQAWYRASGTPPLGDRATVYWQAALDGYEASYRSFSEQTVLSKNLDLGDRLIRGALVASLSDAGAPKAERAQRARMMFQTMELSKSLLLARELLALRDVDSTEQPILARQVREWEVDQELLRKAYTQGFDLPLADLLTLYRLDRQLARQSEAQAANPDPRPAQLAATAPDLDAARQTLTAAQGLIEFAEADSVLYVLYTDRDTTAIYLVPRPKVLAWKDSLVAMLAASKPAATDRYIPVAGSLYRTLIGPVRSALRKRTELLIVPSVGLSNLPFAALVSDTAAGGYVELPYLVRSHDLRILGSWRTDRQLARLREPDEAIGPAPRVGVWTNPDLAGYLVSLADQLLAALPGDHFHGQDNRTTFLERADQYDWLHLSVHAAGNPLELHENYLYLSPGDSLNGLFISRLILPARLVVLAACSTSLGFANAREGTYSLRRSFHRAGVPDVVASLYDINAVATQVLLEEFYANVLAGQSFTRALANAQRACAAEKLGGRMVWPGNWAGLVLG